jgi:choline dehydrogenase-like flavoprotein
VTLVTVAVLPDSLRACCAAWRSTALLQSAAVPDAVVVVEAADAVVVAAGAAVEDGVLAVLSGSEELHPAAISATSAVTTSRPMVVRRIASHPFVRFARAWA